MMKIKRITHWCVAAFFLVLLFFLNSIVGIFRPDNIQKTDSDRYPSSATTLSGIDYLICNNDIFDSVILSGWSLSVNTKDNSNKCQTVILVSGKNVYETCECNRMNRVDLRGTFRGKYAMVGGEHGVFAQFDTYNLPDGIYDIYIYNMENDTNYGISKTGYKIQRKNGITFQIEKQLIELSDEEISNSNELVTCAIDSVQIENAVIKASGWGIVPGCNNDAAEYFLEFESESGERVICEAFTTSRYDISAAYGEQYRDSGIVSEIAESELPGFGIYKVSVLIRIDDILYRSAPEVYNYEEMGIIDKIGVSFEMVDITPQDSFLIEDAKISDNIAYTVDVCVYSDRSLRVVGSCSAESVFCTDYDILIELCEPDGNKGLYLCLKTECQESTEQLSGDYTTTYDFIGRLPTWLNQEGLYRLSFYVISDSQVLEAADEYIVSVDEASNILSTELVTK